MQILPYLFLDGRCDEAIEFYVKALGATVGMLMRFDDSPEKGMGPPGAGKKVMHARLQIGAADLLLFDGRCSGRPEFKGFSLSLLAKDAAEAEKLFAALSDGGKVGMPMEKTFFSPKFGMLEDRFGVAWMVYVAPQGQ